MSNKEVYEHLNISKSTLLRKCKMYGLSLSRNAPADILNSLTEEKFRGFIERGYTLDEAAKVTGVSRSYLAKKASELNVSFSKSKFNLEEYLILKDKGMLDKDIAAKFGMTPHGLHGRKVDFNLDLADRNFQILTKEELVDLYITKKMPIERISSVLNKGITPIYEALRKYNVPLRREDGINIKKNDLINMLNDSKDYPEIASRFRTTVDSVKKAIIRNDLDEVILVDEKGSLLNRFTSLQLQMIYGSMLGDGYIDRGHTNCRLKFEHCLAQKEYVKYKYKIIENFIQKRGLSIETRYDNRTKKFYTKVTARTYQSKVFTRIASFFYNPNKYVNKEVLSFLDERGLAFWFMDDGYRYNNYGLALCTESFSEEDLKKIVTYFKERWNISCDLNPLLKRIFFKKQAALSFQSLISPHILPLFEYKLISPSYVKKLESRLA